MTSDTENELQAQIKTLTAENVALTQSVDRLRRVRSALLEDARATRAELASLRAQQDALGSALRPFLATRSTAGTSQDIDLDEVENAWDEVLARVKRVTYARLSESQPVGLDERILTVRFPTPTLARQFGEGAHTELLEDALLNTLGRHVQVQC